METSVRKFRTKSRLKYDAVKRAIKGSAGIIAVIAGKLNCDWHTANKYILDHPKLKRLIENERETLVDLAEGKLAEKVESGDNWAIGRVLDGPGKKRGWPVKSEVEHGMNKETAKTFADFIKQESKESQ